jgi:hypothetical protein
MIARGIMLGADQPVILHMLDISPAVEALNGVKMELVDAAFPLLKGKLIQFNNLLKGCLLFYVDYHPCLCLNLTLVHCRSCCNH